MSFPSDSGCEPFSVPLNPTQDMLDKWAMWVARISLHPSLILGHQVARDRNASYHGTR